VKSFLKILPLFWAISVFGVFWFAMGALLLLLRRKRAVGRLGAPLAGFRVAALWSYLSTSANLSHMQSWVPHAFNVADSDQHPTLSALCAVAGLNGRISLGFWWSGEVIMASSVRYSSVSTLIPH
jgi:hypothetical protein